MEISEKIENLYQMILKLETTEECKVLLEDLCTRKEGNPLQKHKVHTLLYR